jgi:hypothetical protein
MMDTAVVSPLANWDNFYVIVGSSAGALTGLQFVVIALVANTQQAGSMLEIRAFGTPTVVHFCAALLTSAIVTAPWHRLTSVAFCLASLGAAGVVYAITVVQHARRQTGYNPDAEDWTWYVVLPKIAYGTLAVSAFVLPSHPDTSLFVVAATALLLLLVGIHNSWDTVTYIAIRHAQRSNRKRGTDESNSEHP